MMDRKHIGRRLGAGAALALALAGCGVVGGGNSDGGGKQDGGAADMTTVPLQPKFSSLYADYFAECKSCHTPTAIGRGPDTETALDFTSVTTAYNTITKSKAAGLKGNQMACNGVSFVVPGMPGSSLILAVLDAPTRAAFKSGTCDKDAVSDMTTPKVGAVPSAAFVTALKDWIQAGAQNN